MYDIYNLHGQGFSSGESPADVQSFCVSGCASKKWQLAGIQPTIILQDGVVWESVALQVGHGNDDDGDGDDVNEEQVWPWRV